MPLRGAVSLSAPAIAGRRAFRELPCKPETRSDRGPGRSELHFAAIDEQLRPLTKLASAMRAFIDHLTATFQSGVLAPRV
jgi:hypothetical protein